LRLFLGFFVSFLIVFFVHSASDSQELEIKQGRMHTRIANDESGNVYVVWFDHHLEPSKVYFTCSTDFGKTWNDPVPLDDSSSGSTDAHDTNLVVDENGNIYVSWRDDRTTVEDIFFNKSNDFGATWLNNDQRIGSYPAGEVPADHAEMCADNFGCIYVSANKKKTESRKTDLVWLNKSMDFGESWLTAGKTIFKENKKNIKLNKPEISCDPDGKNVYVVWREIRKNLEGKNIGDVGFSRSTDYGETWLTIPCRLDTDGRFATNSGEPEIASDNNGNIYVVWNDERGSLFNVSNDYGDTWLEKDIRLNNDAPSEIRSKNTEVDCDNQGHVYAVWFDDRNGKFDVYLNTSSDYGHTWFPASRRLNTNAPGESHSIFPRICEDGGGHVYVTWADNRNGKWDIYTNVSDDFGVTWRETDIGLSLGMKSYDAHRARVSCDSHGNVHVVWQEKRKRRIRIFYDRSNDFGSTWLPKPMRLN